MTFLPFLRKTYSLTAPPPKKTTIIQGNGGMDFSQYCLFLGEMTLLSPRHTVLVLSTGIPNSPLSSCLSFNAFRRTDRHFCHTDVIWGCFEELVILFLAALHVYYIKRIKIHPYPTFTMTCTAITN